jgi:hypothetical protein
MAGKFCVAALSPQVDDLASEPGLSSIDISYASDKSRPLGRPIALFLALKSYWLASGGS